MLMIVAESVVYRLNRVAQHVHALAMNAHHFLVPANMLFICTVFSRGYKLKIKNTFVHYVAESGILHSPLHRLLTLHSAPFFIVIGSTEKLGTKHMERGRGEVH